MRGRSYALPEDMTDLVPDVLRHRLVLSYEALADGLSADDLIRSGDAEDPCRPDKPLAPHGRRPKELQRPTPVPRPCCKRLEWTVLRRLDGLLQGDYRTLLRGAGIDLADLREYQYHDDVRHIDWNVTARLQQPYVRQFTEDRELAAWFLLDLSAQRGLRLRRACQARRRARVRRRAGAAAHAPRQPRRRAALRHLGDTVIPARTRPPARAAPAAAHARSGRPPAAGATQLRDLLLPGERIVKRRSTIFVVSDFISAPGWEEALARWPRRHDVTAVRLYDPLEMALPDIGLVTMRDAETGEQLLVDTTTPASATASPPRRSRARRAADFAGAPASTRWSWPPTTTCSTPSCASPTCAGSAAAWRPAAAAVAPGRPED
jgi:uncharacterized protein (DUF58 family)